MSILQVGFVAVLPALCGFIGGILGGWISDTPAAERPSRSAPPARCRSSPGCCCRRRSSAATTSTTQWAVIALMSLAFFGKGVGALGWAVMADVAPKEATGLAGGCSTPAATSPASSCRSSSATSSVDRIVRRRAGLRRRARAARGGELPRDRRRHPAHRAAAGGRRAGGGARDAMSPRAPRLLLAAAFLLFATWSLVVPINEAPDEPAHWQYARYLRDHWRAAALRARLRGSQLAAARLRPVRAVRGRRRRARRCSSARRPDGDARQPGRPAAVPQHRRGLSPVLAAAAGAAAGGGDLGRHRRSSCGAPASPPAGAHVGLLAALLVTLLPMFAFRAGHVSNDALVGLLRGGGDVGLRPPAARAVRLARRLVDVGGGRPRLPVEDQRDRAGPAVRAGAPRRRAGRRRGGRPGLAPRRRWRLAGAIVAPWSIRNVVLYGDPFASEAMRHAVAHLITDRLAVLVRTSSAPSRGCW